MSGDQPVAYIVDTNVLSNRGAVEADANLIEWLRLNAGRICISVVTVAEMQRGLLLLDAKLAKITDRRVRRREHDRLSRKRAWYDELTRRFADRIEPIDLNVAERWAEISVRFPSLRDGDKAILATALSKGLAVATENVGDYRASGVVLVNPFDRDTWQERADDDPIIPLMRR